MLQICRPIQIKSFKQPSSMNSQSQLQYLTQFQCNLCGFINHDQIMVDIHQMGCALESMRNQEQISIILIKDLDKQNILLPQNSQIASCQNDIVCKTKKEKISRTDPYVQKRFDMIRHLGLQPFGTKYCPNNRKKGGYKCKFCESCFHSKIAVTTHQNNCHFLELKEVLQYIVMTKMQENQQQKFLEIQFKPFQEQGAFKYYKCIHCSYTNKNYYRLYQHIQSFCSHRNSQNQAQFNPITSKKNKRNHRVIVLKKRFKEKFNQCLKQKIKNEDSFEGMQGLFGNQPTLELDDVKKNQSLME